jgi:signal transduction histidine kinase
METRRWTALHPAVMRSNLARSLDRALLALLVAGALFALLQFALLPFASPAGPVLVLFPVDLLAYLLAGLLAWYRRPSNRIGALILWAGMTVFLSAIFNTGIPVFVSVGAIAATLPLAAVVHLLHAFPSGRVRGVVPRAAVAAGYLTALVLGAPRYLFDPAGPAPGLVIADWPAGVAIGAVLQAVAGLTVMVVTAGVLVGRLFAAGPEQRRTLVPLYGYGIVAVLFVPLSTRVLAPALGWSSAIEGGAQLIVLGLIPIAFALAVLRGGFARTGELEELGTWLGASGGERPALTTALAATLGDPSLQLWFWVPERSLFVDVQGAPVADPSSSRRGVEVVELDGRRIGAIVYDAELIGEPELVRTAGQVVAIALDRERLTAELRASRRALQLSRERLVDAADAERRRIAQDLHDSLQMQLVLLALEAQQLANADGTAPDAAGRATALRKGIDEAAAALRQIVHEVMPAALLERGLAAAVDDLADRLPIPTTVDLDPGPLPAAVESTAYFVVSEALTNAVKHSQARGIAVRIGRAGDLLHIDVSDDGVGGAAANGGAGLRGIADRVDVLGGRLVVDSQPGQGTRIHVEVSCES